MKRITTTTAPATVIACIALAIALSGTSYAAFVLPANSVGAKQIKRSAVAGKKIAKNAVTGAKISKNAVTSVKVKNGTLLAADFKAGQLPRGPQGPAGPQGPKGDPGPATGPAGGDLQGSYPNPTIAPGAVTASKLVAEEPWRNVGAAGQPAFGGGWWHYDAPTYEAVGFRKDRDGAVHLRGAAGRAANSPASVMFTLPAGYRPATLEVFAVASTDGMGNLAPSGGIIEVDPSGFVVVYDDTDDRFVSLSGISFTAAQ